MTTGAECIAPVPLDPQGRRMWDWGDLLALVAALAVASKHAPAA
ncbi:hypothetical protein [Streptomyces sp. NPDC058665]